MPEREEQVNFNRSADVSSSSTLQLLQLLDAALHLHGLGGLVAETLDEGFRVLYLFLLVLPGPQLLFPPLLAQADEFVILHLVVVDAAAGYLDGAGGDIVEEGAVVADQHHGIGPGGKELLQPLDGLDVQVIGRLVQQEDVGLHQQELGQLDTHAPPTGELAGGTVEVGPPEAQALKRALQLALVIVPAHQGEAIILTGKAVYQFLVGSGLVVRALGHLQLKVHQAGSQLVDMGEGRLCLLAHRAGIGQAHHLGQVTDGTLARQADRAGGGMLLTGQNLEQGGLSGTVLAHEGDAVLAVDDEAHVLKQGRGIELHGEGVY